MKAPYQSNEDAPADSAFEPGRLEHLVAGNQGRRLDPRRTPIRVLGRRDDLATFTIEITAFEDKGAIWDLPVDEVARFQFERQGARLPPAEVEQLRDVAARWQVPLEIPCAAANRARTEARIDEQAAGIIMTDAVNPASAEGVDRLIRSLEAHLSARDLGDIEREFAAQFVSNPQSGEIVKGHRIVLAELGLAPFVGTIVRDPATFSDRWSRERRAAHIVARMAFVRAMLRHCGLDRLVVYRGFSAAGRLETRPPQGLLSTTTDRHIAEHHFRGAQPSWTGVLVRKAVPCERVLMTYFETPQLNAQFRESEVVVLADPGPNGAATAGL